MKHKKRLYYFAILFLAVLFGSLLYFKPLIRSMVVNEFNDRSNEKLIGVFDRNKKIQPNLIDNIKHVSVKWKSFSLSSNKQALQKAILENKNLLLTVETWASFGNEHSSVLDEVLNGSYDKDIKVLANLAAQSKGTVFVRWNPQMEVPVKQYPWQYQSPSKYIDAFNYFASHLKKLAPKVKIVWAPTGYPGDSEFWPGKNNVDLISILLTDSDDLRLKLHRMRFMDKPVFILSANGSGNGIDSILKKVDLERELYENTIYSKENFNVEFAGKQARKRLSLGVFDPDRKSVV